MPWSRVWQPQYSCLENPHGQRSLVGYSKWGSQRIRHYWVTKNSTAHTLHRWLKLRLIQLTLFAGFPGGSSGQESACNTGDLGSIPGLGWSPREGNGHLLEYSGLENSMDCIVHGVTKSQIRLSDFHSRLFATLLLDSICPISPLWLVSTDTTSESKVFSSGYWKISSCVLSQYNWLTYKSQKFYLLKWELIHLAVINSNSLL